MGMAKEYLLMEKTKGHHFGVSSFFLSIAFDAKYADFMHKMHAVSWQQRVNTANILN